MKELINGIHHICVKCDAGEIEKVKDFYCGVLGLPILRQWGEPELKGFMFDTRCGLIEVFTNAESRLEQGSIRHMAFATDDVEGCIEAARKAGYEIKVEPKDIVMPSDPPLHARVGFVIGPLNEEIEFFCEKKQ